MALPIALRGSEGIWLVGGPDALNTKPDFPRESNSRCKAMIFSKDGAYLAWCNGEAVKIVRTSDSKTVQEIDRPKTNFIMFSPKNSILATWEPYTVDRENKQGVPNLFLFDVQSGRLIKSLIQKKSTYWCPQWTNDEVVCCRNVNNELHFFENGNFDEIKTKLLLQKVAGYSLTGAGPPYLVSGYVPGAKGQPSFVRAYKYPNFGGPGAAIANRTFFKADKVEMVWNKAGTGMLLLTTTETSESSYYGDQGLHYVGTNGDSSLVHLGKNGPVYHMEWNPKSTEFCVVYGFMPAKATIYNTKTEAVFDFGTGPRNYGFYNPQGTILCLCGFGNLRGIMEFWDVKQKKLIVQAQSPDTTGFQWFPDGEHVLTATTSPRLRVGNGYRIWHYTGVVLEQTNTDKGQELFEAFCKPAPDGTFPEKPIMYKAVASSAVTPQAENTMKAYRPPGARGEPSSIKLHEYEAPSNAKNVPPKDPNKAPTKNQKRREAKKKASAQDGATPPSSQQQQPATTATSQQQLATAATSQQANPDAQSTGDPEKDKKLRNLRKKLQQVEKLKMEKMAGKPLEKNQLDKLKTEVDLVKQIKDLELS